MAQAKQRHVIHIDSETMFLLYSLKQSLQQIMLAFHHRAADPADQMVMGLIVSDLVVHLPTPAECMNQAHLTQKIKRAINRGATDGWISPMDGFVHFLRCDVIIRLPHDFQDQLPLRRQPGPPRVQLGGKIGGELSHITLSVIQKSLIAIGCNKVVSQKS
jgi:hypothetical protein